MITRVGVGSPTPAEAPVVSFIIPVKNDERRLRRCLATIRANDYPAHLVEIVVADNGSDDGSAEAARALGARVLDLPRLSVSQLRNQAAAAATGRILAFVDADHEIDARWISSAVAALREPSVGAAGALCDPPTNGTWVQRTYGALRGRRVGRQDVEWLGSGNLAVWREVFEAQRGFDETLETCEDVELCQRIRRGGHRILSDDRLRSEHLGDPATLRALFKGELWRGRDNLRASLRGPLTPRSLPSIVLPIVHLGLLALFGIGLALAPFGWTTMAPVAVGLFLGLVGLRTARILLSSGGGLLQAGRTFIVAAVYDSARALALVFKVGHRSRPHTQTT